MNYLNEMIQQAEYYHRWSWAMKLLTRQGCTYNIQPGSKEIKIAIIDSGVDRNHPDLAHSIVSEGKSFIDDMPATVDLSGHGTMMAGAIAARGKLLGIGPGLGIVPYKIIQTNNSGHSSDVIKAIDLAIDDRNDIINLSLGSYKSTIGESDAGLIREYNQIIRKAASKGIIVVGSMGTHGMFLSKKVNTVMCLEGYRMLFQSQRRTKKACWPIIPIIIPAITMLYRPETSGHHGKRKESLTSGRCVSLHIPLNWIKPRKVKR